MYTELHHGATRSALESHWGGPHEDDEYVLAGLSQNSATHALCDSIPEQLAQAFGERTTAVVEPHYSDTPIHRPATLIRSTLGAQTYIYVKMKTETKTKQCEIVDFIGSSIG